MAKRKGSTDIMPFDENKLRHQIESHGYTLAGLSEDLGYGRSYIGNLVNRSKGLFEQGIPRRVMMLLETVGIHYEDYEPDPEPHPLKIDPVEYEDQPLPWDLPELAIPDDGLRYEPEQKTITVKLDEEQLDYILGKLQDIIYASAKKAWNE